MKRFFLGSDNLAGEYSDLCSDRGVGGTDRSNWERI